MSPPITELEKPHCGLPARRLSGTKRLNDAMIQSLYHFTTGGHVEDTRLTTLPPYGLDH
jgi:hypothetical protein